MAKKIARRRGGEQHWTGVLERFESSGLSSAAFCRREGVALSSFQRWRRRLGTVTGEFIELSPPSAPSASTSSWLLEVALPNGVQLRFRG